MRNILRVFLILSITSLIFSCSYGTYAPTIDITNYSNDYIYNPVASWNGHKVAAQYQMRPSMGSATAFVLRKKSDFFGPVHIEWENAQRKKIVKDFIFTKKDFPEYGEKKKMVALYLNQEDFEMALEEYKFDPSKFSEEEKERNKKLDQLSREHDIVCHKGKISTTLAEALKSPTKALVELSKNPMSISECQKAMPIYKPENMPRIELYRKIYNAREEEMAAFRLKVQSKR